MSDTPLWIPSAERAAASQVQAFIKEVDRRHGVQLTDYRDLHAWSVDDPAAFWEPGLGLLRRHRRQGRAAARSTATGCRARASFPDATLNFAENLLRRAGRRRRRIVFRGEDKVEHAAVLRRTARARVAPAAGVARRRRRQGRPGRRHAAEHAGERSRIMLAATSIGAIWSSCSPDFGERGVLDRFGQIEPKLFIAADGYWYAGKRIDDRRQARPIVGRTAVRADAVVIVPYLGEAEEAAAQLPHGADARAPSSRPSQPKPVDVRAAAVRSPALHPVLVGHDRRAEMHRALAPAARCSSTSRSTGCTATCSRATGCSTSPPAAG